MAELHADKASREAHERRIESMQRILGDELVALFKDPKVVEIMANPDSTVFVERLGGGMEPFGTIDPQRVQSFLGLMADYLHTTVSREKPIVEGAMPAEFLRSRFAGTIPPLVEGASFSIRLPARSIFTLDQYVERGVMTVEQHDQIVQAVTDRKNILVSGGTGCFGKGHPVLMFDGSIKAVEDVRVGDRVMGPDGTERVVKDVHCGIDQMVEVVPSKGPSFVVNQGHQLALVSTHKADRSLCKMNILEWTRSTEKFRHEHKLYFSQPLDSWGYRELPVDPYFLGVLLGDGSFMSSVSVSKPDPEIRLAVNDVAQTFGLRVRTYERSENNFTYKLLGTRAGRNRSGNRLIDTLKELGLYRKSGEFKFIPSLYKTASLQQRLSLLAGLLDTDGHFAEKAASFDFISKSKALAEDTAFVARSCGLYAKVTECEKSCPSGDHIFTGVYHRVYISGDVGRIPMRIPRKQAARNYRDYLVAGIRQINSLGLGAYYGFEVDHPDHLFVDGHFMVQGNSGKTSLLNAVSDVIAKQAGTDQRIVILEDTREILCAAPNTVQFLTDDDAGIDLTRLLKLTLRYRPDRIFVGEVRDKSALALLKAWGTGHPGGLATLHANNPQAALLRLDQLCQEAGVPSQQELIREAVDLVIQIARDPTHPSGRRITDMLEVS